MEDIYVSYSIHVGMLITFSLLSYFMATGVRFWNGRNFVIFYAKS